MILLFTVLSCMAGTNALSRENSPIVETVSQTMAVQEYTGWLTVSASQKPIYDDESTVTVTDNGNTVDFDLKITILGFFTGNVHIGNIPISNSTIAPGTTGTVVIAGKTYTVVFNSGTINDTVCSLNITVKATPLGDLNIVFDA